MNTIIRPLRILLGVVCLSAGAFTPAGAAPGAGDIVDLIGVRVTDVKGRQHRIGVSMGKVQAAALVFLDTACPVATRYIPALNELHDDAQARGVSLYGVLSNPDIGWRESAEFVDDFSVEFPVILDSAGDLTLRLGPRVTSESFVISTANRIVYRGRIDDRFAAVGRLRTRITSHDLRDIVEDVSRGGRAEPYETEAVGCFHYAWGELGEPGAGTGEVTWARHVAPLLQANCVECHRRGGIAPFSLEGYDNAKRWHRMVAWMTDERLMPPWRAVPGSGEFRDEDLRIPPGEESYWRRFSMDVPAGMTLTDVTPHMHFLGREFISVATLPDGRERPLIRIADWDFRWQNTFTYREPVHLPAGSRIDVWVRYDNSASNPQNPTVPPRTVTWGWETTDEMSELWIGFIPDSPNDRGRIASAAERSWYRRARVSGGEIAMLLERLPAVERE